MSEIVEPVVEPVSVVDPVVEPVVEPISVVDPVVEPIVEPVVEPIVEPVLEPIVEPVLEPVAVVEPVITPTPGNFTLTTPVTVVNTLTINNYRYALSNIILHTSVTYGIDCFNDNTLVKSIVGVVEGEQYREWTTDDWMDAFIKSKVDALNTNV